MKYASVSITALAATVFSVKMAGMINKELATENRTKYFWSGSQDNTSYMRNTQRNFKIVVAKRVQSTR